VGGRMHAAVEELHRLVPPPDQPIGAVGDWEACEQELQVQLPEDCKTFIESYGGGTLCSLFAISSRYSSPQLWKVSVRDWWAQGAGIDGGSQGMVASADHCSS
jgi:hypothetical protein